MDHSLLNSDDNTYMTNNINSVFVFSFSLRKNNIKKQKPF